MTTTAIFERSDHFCWPTLLEAGGRLRAALGEVAFRSWHELERSLTGDIASASGISIGYQLHRFPRVIQSSSEAASTELPIICRAKSREHICGFLAALTVFSEFDSFGIYAKQSQIYRRVARLHQRASPTEVVEKLECIYLISAHGLQDSPQSFSFTAMADQLVEEVSETLCGDLKPYNRVR